LFGGRCSLATVGDEIEKTSAVEVKEYPKLERNFAPEEGRKSVGLG
jgi:hypothetical protein